MVPSRLKVMNFVIIMLTWNLMFPAACYAVGIRLGQLHLQQVLYRTYVRRAKLANHSPSGVHVRLAIKKRVTRNRSFLTLPGLAVLAPDDDKSTTKQLRADKSNYYYKFISRCTTYPNTQTRQARCRKLNICILCTSDGHKTNDCLENRYKLPFKCAQRESRRHISTLLRTTYLGGGDLNLSQGIQSV